MLTPPDQSTHKPLFDAEAIAAELEELAAQHEGPKELRIAVAIRLKRALAESRKAAEANLLKDRLGIRCASDLCRVQDEIIRVLFGFATKHLYATESRSEAERRRDRRLRARPDGARLRHRSLVSASLQTNRLGRVDR
jgi:[protein-PII] uridylyltransferase